MTKKTREQKRREDFESLSPKLQAMFKKIRDSEKESRIRMIIKKSKEQENEKTL